MACDTRRITIDGGAIGRLKEIASAIDRLEKYLTLGTVKVVVGSTGAVAFKGWNDRDEIGDVCAYRRLAARNSPALRRAVARAEALAGRAVDARSVASGMHSHDGGKTWGAH